MSAVLLFLAADACFLLWRRFNRPTLLAPPLPGATLTADLRQGLRHILTLPGLGRLVLLASAINGVLGATLATTAAMTTGVHHQSGAALACLQAAGAAATIVVLLIVARIRAQSLPVGLLAVSLIMAGGLLSWAASSFGGYVAGYLLIIGADKIFNVFIRSRRMRLIPAQDMGKTSGLIVMLNNLSQPLAGLAVSLGGATLPTGVIILLISLMMSALALASARGLVRNHRQTGIAGQPPSS